MGIAKVTELPRRFENELGGRPLAVLSWAVTLTNDTLANNPATHTAVINDPGINVGGVNLANYGSPHPEFAWIGLRKVTLTERHEDSPYHILVTAEYGVVSANELLSPLSRTSEWSFDAKPSQVAALYYWDGTTRRPLVNSAFDFYEGLQTEELIVVARITKNYPDFDAAGGPQDLIASTNKLNASSYLGTNNVHCWKVAGVQTEYVTEVYNNVSYNYWRTTSEIHFRESTWNLFLPDVGYNYLDGNQKRRAMVFDSQNAEWVASPNPVALNGSGGINLNGYAHIHEFRVHREANFSALFGVPPTV